MNRVLLTALCVCAAVVLVESSLCDNDTDVCIVRVEMPCSAVCIEDPTMPHAVVAVEEYANVIGSKVAFQCDACSASDETPFAVCEHDGWNYHGQCVDDSQYLVDGPNGVGDDQLSSSTYWCQNRNWDHWCTAGVGDCSAKYARLNSTGFMSGSWIGGWENHDVDQYIQVDFLQTKMVFGIALQGRWYTDLLLPEHQQWVTKVSVLHSIDCLEFHYITDDNSTTKIFDGNTNPTETVIRNFPETVEARCIRINPREWHVSMSLRFDVLGC